MSYVILSLQIYPIKSHNIHYDKKIVVHYSNIMIILKVEETKKESNGKTYVNYIFTYGVEKTADNGAKYLAEQRVNVQPSAVDELIQSGKIVHPKDLVGHSVNLFRSVPYFISKAEVQYRFQVADKIQVIK